MLFLQTSTLSDRTALHLPNHFPLQLPHSCHASAMHLPFFKHVRYMIDIR